MKSDLKRLFIVSAEYNDINVIPFVLVLIRAKRSCGPTKLDRGQLSRWSVYLLIIYSGDKSTFKFRFLVVQ